MVDLTNKFVIVMILLLTSYSCFAQDLLFPDQIEGRLKANRTQKDAATDSTTQAPEIVDRTIIDMKCNKGAKIRNRCRQIVKFEN
nr:unnamed protein product [Callosobruchus analis]